MKSLTSLLVILHAAASPCAAKAVASSSNPRLSSLYEEARDMAAASFLIYTFGYMREAARKNRKFGTMALDNDARRATKDTERSSSTCLGLVRTFTPDEVKTLLLENLDELRDEFGSKFKETETTIQSLELFDPSSRLVEFDDKTQKHACVYGLTVNDAKKRITLAFRGTDNKLAFKTNWLTNCHITKRKVSVTGLPVDNVSIHKGFYDYLFERDEDRHGDKIRFDEIKEDVSALLQENPGYSLYVTGHSLGGALAGVAAFNFAMEGSVPTPVTCITFGAPRFGDASLRKAVNHLEASGKLRFVRVVNDDDLVTTVPMLNYKHVGLEVKLFKRREKAEICYPNDGIANKFKRMIGNSVFSNINLGYDHGEYRERLQKKAESLRNTTIESLYANQQGIECY